LHAKSSFLKEETTRVKSTSRIESARTRFKVVRPILL